MGRVKLKIQRLQSLSSRQVTYGKRRAGILKKAQEISVLCDIEIILLMFSPTGKPSIFRTENSNIDEMIAKYAELTPNEREKRRLESLETLKRNFKKLDQDVDIDEFLDPSTSSIEEMQNRVRMLQAQLTDLHKRLSWWTNPDKIEDIKHLNQMENSLRESLNMVRMHKDCFSIQQEKIAKDTLIALERKIQFENAMNFPIMATIDQDCQNQSSLLIAESQHIILPNETNFLASRDMECSQNASFPGCSGFFNDVKEQNLENSVARQEGITIDDYTSSPHMRLPLPEQYLYQPYGNLNFPDVMEPGREAKFQPTTIDYQINDNFVNLQNNLVPLPGSCAISMLEQNSYLQKAKRRASHVLSDLLSYESSRSE